MQIRRLTENDPLSAPAVDLLKTSFAEASKTPADQLLLTLTSLLRTYILVEGSGLISVGSIVRTPPEYGPARLANIAVQAHMWRQGYGTVMTEGLERAAASLDYSAVRLAAAEEAVGFYERNGYVLQPGPDRTMIKQLDPAVSGIRVGL